MHIEDLMQMIEEDVGRPLRRDLVDWEASRNQQLHQKYRKLLYLEKVEHERIKSGIGPLLRKKREYYGGRATTEVYKEDGAFDLKLSTKKTIPTAKDRILKDELSFYVDSDEDVIAARHIIVQQAEKVEYLKDVLNKYFQVIFLFLEMDIHLNI